MTGGFSAESKPQTRIQHERVPYLAAASERSRCLARYVEAVNCRKQQMLVHLPVGREIDLVAEVFRVDVHCVQHPVARDFGGGELGQVEVEIEQVQREAFGGA